MAGAIAAHNRVTVPAAGLALPLPAYWEQPATPAMRLAALAADERDERDWNQLADLAATPEWDRALSYGTVEAALALD